MMSFYGSTGTTPGSLVRGPAARQSQGVRRTSLYPNPFLDIAQTYLPSTTKGLFQWCEYYALTNPLIATVLYKKATYPVTDVIYEEANDAVRERYRHLFEDVFRIRPFLIEHNLDKACYGNAFVTVMFPIRKWLECSNASCKHRVRVDRVSYRFQSYEFRITCTVCQHEGAAKVFDVPVPSPEEIRLMRWAPQNIRIQYSEATGERIYFLELPKQVKNDITLGRVHVVEKVPQEFIKGAKEGKAIRFLPGQIYHSMRPTVSGRDPAWGQPLIAQVLKQVFYLQVLQKAQEAILFGHIIPMRVLYPAATSSSGEPYSMVNLSNWKEHVNDEIRNFRADSLYVPVMPIPIGYQNIGGEGKALMLANEIRVWSELVVAGLGFPVEFIFCLSGGTWVHTERGMERLDAVVARGAGSTILTHEGPKKITATYRAGVKPQVALRTTLGLELLGAETHPVQVLREDLSLEWVTLEDIVPGDFVCTVKGSDHWPTEAPLLPASSVRQSRRGRPEQAIATPSVVTPEFARFLGHMVAEGRVNAEQINFANTDREVIDDFVRCYEACFGETPHIYAIGAYAERTDKKAWGVTVYRKSLVRFLSDCGLSGLAHAKQIPWVIQQAPKALVGEFLKAYFEGDGGVCFKATSGHCTAVTVSTELSKQVQLMLLRLGVVSSRYEATKASPAEKVTIRGKAHLVEFESSVGFVSSTKRAALARLISQAGSSKDSERLPFVHSHLRLFRERHKIGNNDWQWEPFEFRTEKDWYTVKEVAALLGRGPDAVRAHITEGRLPSTRNDARGSRNKISGTELEAFCARYGRGIRVDLPLLHKEANHSNMRAVPLSFVAEKEPELAARVQALLDSPLIFDEVVSVIPAGTAEMFDVTVEDTHAYIADGIVSHNSGISYSGSNVSLRILENDFLGDREDGLGLLRWIMAKVASYMEWRKIPLKLRPFKMADDLQRSAFNLQLVQMKALSMRTFMEDLDRDYDQEQERVQAELPREQNIQREIAKYQAETQGQGMVVQAKYQAQQQGIMAAAAQEQQAAAAQQQAAQQQAAAEQQAAGQPQPPSPMAGTPGGQPRSAIGGPDSIVGLASPLTAKGVETAQSGAVDVAGAAERHAAKLKAMPEMEQGAELYKIKQKNQALYQLVLQYMSKPVPGTPLPEQRTPRRSSGKALV